MYYVEYKDGFKIRKTPYRYIRNARKFIMRWHDKHPYSSYVPSIYNDYGLVERIKKGDSPMEYMVYDVKGNVRYVRENGSITYPIKTSSKTP